MQYDKLMQAEEYWRKGYQLRISLELAMVRLMARQTNRIYKIHLGPESIPLEALGEAAAESVEAFCELKKGWAAEAQLPSIKEIEVAAEDTLRLDEITTKICEQIFAGGEK